MWKRIFITLLFLALYWLGRFVPVPGVNYGVLKSLAEMSNVGGLEHIMRRVSIFSLDIMPYMSIHIIVMLLIAVVPLFRNIFKNETLGAKKINQFIYGGVIFLSLIQSFFLTLWIERLHTASGVYVVNNPGIVFRLISILSITVGALIIIWLGKQINKYGIGNGISLFLLSGLLMKLRNPLLQMVRETSVLNPLKLIMGLLLFISFIAITLFILKREKRIPIVVSEKESKNTTMSMPLNLAGILPIYFTSSILLFPATIGSLKGELATSMLANIANILTHGTWIAYLSWVILIIFFSYFYTAVVFNPLELVSKMKRFKLSIAGADTERKTAECIDRLMTTNIVLIWSIFLCGAAFLPVFLYRLVKIHIPFTGYELILLVGIILGVCYSLQNRKNLKEVFRCSDIKTALIIKARLESEGIVVRVDDCESYGRLLSLIVGPLAEKIILVNESDYNKSTSLIK
jgi:preprotein translocase subunit SecY